MTDMQQRLEELESRLAYQDDTINSLNDALIGQQAKLTELERILNLMIERIQQSPSDDDQSAEPPPPHY